MRVLSTEAIVIKTCSKWPKPEDTALLNCISLTYPPVLGEPVRGSQGPQVFALSLEAHALVEKIESTREQQSLEGKKPQGERTVKKYTQGWRDGSAIRG